MDKIVECVPNFSEGRDPEFFEAVGRAVSAVPDVILLDVDPDASYNRVVVTFAGAPEAVLEAACRATRVAFERIDMRKHEGEHPRFGAIDVCPFVPVKGLGLSDCVGLARAYGKTVAEELDIPVFLYEAAATRPERKNLANVRAGQYEGLAARLADPRFTPDFGPARFVPKFGAVAAGARFFLVAYNIDLATDDLDLATEIAHAVRWLGDPSRKGHGKLRMTKAMGVRLTPKNRPPFCQVSMNLINYLITPPHVAFEEVKLEAELRSVEVTGSEVVGLIPLEPILMAAEYYLFEDGSRREEPSEEELVGAAVERLGLSDYNRFDPQKKIIELRLAAAGW